VGLGHDGVSTMFKDLWEYDPVADSWTRMADFPGDLRMYMPFYRYFVLNNKLYMYVTSENQFWEFDPSLDSWRKLPNNDAFTGKLIEHGFSCKGKGYFLMWTNEYSLWEYKPSENSLTNLGTISKNPAFDSFILEDRLYLTLDNHRILEYDFSDKSSFSYYWNEDGYCWYIFTLGEKAWMGASVNYLFYPH
jgi:N-acetylneuraminic acid mutarotase